MPTTSWTQLQCVLTDATGNTPYYLTVSGTTSGSPVVIDSTALPTPGNLWLLTSSNGTFWRIRSNLNDGLVLGVDGNGNLQVQTEQLPSPPSQLWSLNALWDQSGNFNGSAGIGLYELGNAQSGYLAPSPVGTPASDGMAVVAGQDGLQTDPGFQWCLSPNPLMQLVQSLPDYNGSPQPSFPVFSGDQATAYAYISNQLLPKSSSDIRSMYGNPGIAWAGYKSTLTTMANGSAASDADFAVVKAQLLLELQAVANITTTFGFVQSLSAVTAIANQNVVSAAVTLVALAVPGSTVGADIVNALETIGLSIISATGAAGTVAAGFIQAGISLAEALSVDSGGLGPPGPLAAVDLWTSLQTGFTSILTELGNAFQSCQLDWGRMQICNTLITQPWPISIELSDLSAADCATIAGNAMSVYALKTLMPAQWQVYECIPGESPSSDATLYVTTSGRTCYLADVQNGTTFPTPALMAKIASLGIDLEDIYEGNNGWFLAQAAFGGTNHAIGGEPISHGLRITVVNDTPNPIIATVWQTDDKYTRVTQLFSATVLPNESMWGPLYEDGSYYGVALVDAVYGNGEPFAAVGLHMDTTVLAGGAVTIVPPVFFPENSAVAYTIPVCYGWDAGAVITNGGVFTGAAMIKVALG